MVLFINVIITERLISPFYEIEKNDINLGQNAGLAKGP
jgi:hypothetical protein